MHVSLLAQLGCISRCVAHLTPNAGKPTAGLLAAHLKHCSHDLARRRRRRASEASRALSEPMEKEMSSAGGVTRVRNRPAAVSGLCEPSVGVCPG